MSYLGKRKTYIETGVIAARPISEIMYDGYKRNANKRKIEFNIDYQTFISFWRLPCYFCGSEIETIGIDRMNRCEGYQIKNIVSCCTRCSLTKRKMNGNEYIEHCKKVAELCQR
jgi:hypothetical protein